MEEEMMEEMMWAPDIPFPVFVQKRRAGAEGQGCVWGSWLQAAAHIDGDAA